MYCHPYFEDIEAIQTHIPSWKNLSPDQLRFTRLAGLSNKIWKVQSLDPTVHPQAVVFRKFGTASIVDREKENYILRALGEKGVGAPFYAGTNTYRIEKYCESNHLNPSELNETRNRRRLAKVLGELHSVKLQNLDHTPLFMRVLEERDLIKLAQEKVLHKEDLYTRDEKKMLEKIMALTDEKEISFLKSIAPKKPESVTFSHNDLHSENILCLKKNHRLLLIDYEYSDYNYRGYDIANLFNESLFEYHSGAIPCYTLDESKFPTQDELHDFIKYYLFFYKFSPSQSEIQEILADEEALNDFIDKNYDRDMFIDEVEDIAEEVKACSLFSHYYWIIWSIVMSKRADIKFDYITYANDRLEIYQKFKRRFFGRKASRTNL